MNLSVKYKKSLDKQWAIRFRTRHPEGDNYDGVVTQIERSFIVMREIINFDFDGTLVLPKSALEGYRDGKFEACCNRILRFNGNIKKARNPKWLSSCASIQDVLKQLMSRDIWPVVEILYSLDGKIETDFFIGPIVRIEDNRFWINDYDASGKWGEKEEIGIKEILRIQFNDTYSTEFNKYMRSL
jgi:hypothetical protein